MYVDAGTATLSTPIAFSGYANFGGDGQTKIMANLTGVPGTGSRASFYAGKKLVNDFAIRIASGVTVAADTVYIEGYKPTDHPNVMLQGTVAGNQIYFGNDHGLNYAVSDVFSGPNGGIVATGVGPYVKLDRIKNAPYLNYANFRFNYLPITVADDNSVTVSTRTARSTSAPTR